MAFAMSVSFEARMISITRSMFITARPRPSTISRRDRASRRSNSVRIVGAIGANGAVGAFFTKTRNDEQRVIDTQRQPQQGRGVHDEDRHVGEVAENPDRPQCRRYRQSTTHNRQSRRNQTAKDEEKENQGDRQRVHLHDTQIMRRFLL